jgi:hypothetical protein
LVAIMAKKGTSRRDLDRHVVRSAPAAERVAEVTRLFPMVLLREDPRVQRAYAAWLARMRDQVPTTQVAAKWCVLMEDARQLLRDAGRPISWLAAGW